MPPRRLRYSRWKRLAPGLHRSHEERIPGPEQGLERLTLYLPGGVLDAAEALARQAGLPSLQAYCEARLTQSIEAERARVSAQPSSGERLAMEGLDDLVAESAFEGGWFRKPAHEPVRVTTTWPRPAPLIKPGGLTDVSLTIEAAGPDDEPAGSPESEPEPALVLEPMEGSTLEGGDAAVKAVLHHAGLLGEAPEAFLPSLRRGEAVDAGTAGPLIEALTDLEAATREAEAIDRRLAFALHRLALEAQLLVTDAWPDLANDAATINAIRLVQEAVDRVLSGEDIRYFPDDGAD